MKATAHPNSIQLSASLEDYLETVYELLRDKRVARVRDIAKARNVRASSVTPAMKRLAELGLVRYHQREYIELTAEGEVAARRVYSRHQILTSFFLEVLNLPAETAEQNACTIEHHLTDEAMDRMVRFFEYLRSCPNASPDFLERFHRCAKVNLQSTVCTPQCPNYKDRLAKTGEATMSLVDLKPGQSGIIRQVNAEGAMRQRLLDMGVLPDEQVHLERVAPTGDLIWIRLGGYQLSLGRTEASAVLLGEVEAS